MVEYNCSIQVFEFGGISCDITAGKSVLMPMGSTHLQIEVKQLQCVTHTAAV